MESNLTFKRIKVPTPKSSYKIFDTVSHKYVTIGKKTSWVNQYAVITAAQTACSQTWNSYKWSFIEIHEFPASAAIKTPLVEAMRLKTIESEEKRKKNASKIQKETQLKEERKKIELEKEYQIKVDDLNKLARKLNRPQI